MILFRKKKSANLTTVEKQRQKRLQRTIKPTTQNSIYYTSLFESGLMHLTGNEWSNTYALGDVTYTSANEDVQEDIMTTCMEALNSLDAGNTYQLHVIQRKLHKDIMEDLLFEETGDAYDDYREEYNKLIKSRIGHDKKNFQIDKYITVKTQAYERSLAETQLREIGITLENNYKGIDVSLDRLNGMERMAILSGILRHNFYPSYDYQDIALSGLRTKDFIAPDRLHFLEDKIKVDQRFFRVLYARNYPTFMTDKLIKKLTDVGVEIIITVQGEPYDPAEFSSMLSEYRMNVKGELIEQQTKAIKAGVTDPDLATGGKTREVDEAINEWEEAINKHDQKSFKGIIGVLIPADSEDELKLNTQKIKAAARGVNVTLSECYYHQEEGLNTLLPLGKTYLNVRQKYLRDMTTANLGSQIPFSNVDLQSQSDRALYYGQNQLTNNVITVDRKGDLNAANGVIFGASGSGKGVTTKTLELIPSWLKYIEDMFLTVDPEDEYSNITRALGGQVVDIYNGSQTHINILDLPDIDKLRLIDPNSTLDPIGDKSDLLISIFETILSEVTDEEVTIIDRVTRKLYQKFASLDRIPTLVDWHDLLLQQKEAAAQNLATKSEIYAKGSQNLFAHETNINLDNRMVNFNLKRMKDGKLKDISLLIIQDFIWNRVIENQGIRTLRIYFDEAQTYFKRPAQAAFFGDIFARFRKYGAIPTAITQSIITMASSEEGLKLLSNSEFMILLKHKPQDLQVLRKVVNNLPAALESYLLKPKEKGSGLILAGDTIVPFSNNIPRQYKLFNLANTDA